MYTVFMKGNSNNYRSGFPTWEEANRWGQLMFGPHGFEIEQDG